MLTDSDPNLTNSLRKSKKKRRFGKHIKSPTICIHTYTYILSVCTHIKIIIESVICVVTLHLNLIRVQGAGSQQGKVSKGLKTVYKSMKYYIIETMLSLLHSFSC